MKKLQKLVLNKAVKMTGYQMKHITGGYGSENGSIYCVWSWTGLPNDPDGSNSGYCELSCASECEARLRGMWGSEGTLTVSCS